MLKKDTAILKIKVEILQTLICQDPLITTQNTYYVKQTLLRLRKSSMGSQ
jgi:hypothetical protein